MPPKKNLKSSNPKGSLPQGGRKGGLDGIPPVLLQISGEISSNFFERTHLRLCSKIIQAKLPPSQICQPTSTHPTHDEKYELPPFGGRFVWLLLATTASPNPRERHFPEALSRLNTDPCTISPFHRHNQCFHLRRDDCPNQNPR